MMKRSKELLLNSGRRMVTGAFIVAVCALATGCPHNKGYFAPSPLRANHVAAHIR